MLYLIMIQYLMLNDMEMGSTIFQPSSLQKPVNHIFNSGKK
jgi:hypothetical protein